LLFQTLLSQVLAMAINVFIAFSNLLFSEGVLRILRDDPVFNILDMHKPGATYSPKKLEGIGCDVVLTDITTLYNSFPEGEPPGGKRFILFDTDCGKENIVSAVLTKNLSGVLLANSTPEHLLKSIKAVSKGEVWIDKDTVKNVLNGVNALREDKTSQLSEKETAIVNLIIYGFTNKEIAAKLHVSEPTVKTHLNRIFRKLNIKNRAQLVSYAVKKQDVHPAARRPHHI